MKSLSRLVLNAYHGHVYTLLDYVLYIADTSSSFASSHTSSIEQDLSLTNYIIRDSDPAAYKDLLVKSLVAEVTSDTTRSRSRVKISEASSSMNEVLLTSIE